jgi:hypothetical protein
MNVPAFFRGAYGRRDAAPLLWKYSKDLDDRKINVAKVVC